MIDCVLSCSHSISIEICSLDVLTQVTAQFLKAYSLKDEDATNFNSEKKGADHMV